MTNQCKNNFEDKFGNCNSLDRHQQWIVFQSGLNIQQKRIQVLEEALKEAKDSIDLLWSERIAQERERNIR